jgi:hypothetical protein
MEWDVDLRGWLGQAVDSVEQWQSGYPPFGPHSSLQVSEERFAEAFAEFADRMRDNYPYFHPSYAGQMLKPPHPAAVAGYLAAMLVNPNNHALDGGKVTSQMEKEVVAQLAGMFGFGTHLGHLTSSGTIANLEALYVARELHPDRGVAYSAEAHYTHGRMCGVLGMAGTTVGTDAAGRIDVGALGDLLAGGRIGTVVATAGTTGLGAIAGTGSGCMSMRPTADSSPCWRVRPVRRALTRGRGVPSPSATRSWSTRTSTGFSPTAAARCCSPILRSAGSTLTTPRTPISLPTSCTSARSAWNARGPARRPPHSG